MSDWDWTTWEQEYPTRSHKSGTRNLGTAGQEQRSRNRGFRNSLAQELNDVRPGPDHTGTGTPDQEPQIRNLGTTGQEHRSRNRGFGNRLTEGGFA
ncbi:unnamed protein product [Caretta caretta]